MNRLLAPMLGAALAALVACGGTKHELTVFDHSAEGWAQVPVTGPVADGTPVSIDHKVMMSVTGPAQPRKGTGDVLACVFTQASTTSDESFTVGPDDWQAVTPTGTTVGSVLYDGADPFLEQELPPRTEGRDGYVCFDIDPRLVAAVEYGDGLIRWEMT